MSVPKINPNYYAIIPASVRYDKELPAAAKLLYGEIAALSNQEGFCWASNRYFAGLYETTPRTVQNWLTDLETRGYIAIHLLDTNSGTSREIYMTEAHENNFMGGMKKISPPHEKNFTHNNTTNTIENTIYPKTSDEATDSQDAKTVRKVYEVYLKCFKLGTVEWKMLGSKDRANAMERAEKRYKLTDKRRKAIKVRLADAGEKMLLAAIIGYSRQKNFEGRKHWAGDNDNGWVADLADFICRSYEQVEKGANYYESQKTTKNSGDPWADL